MVGGVPIRRHWRLLVVLLLVLLLRVVPTTSTSRSDDGDGPVDHMAYDTNNGHDMESEDAAVWQALMAKEQAWAKQALERHGHVLAGSDYLQDLLNLDHHYQPQPQATIAEPVQPKQPPQVKAQALRHEYHRVVTLSNPGSAVASSLRGSFASSSSLSF